MQKYDVSKFIISNFITEVPDVEKNLANRIVINEIVDGWSNSVYFQPREQIKINHYFPHNNYLM